MTRRVLPAGNPTIADFWALRRSVFRLETLPSYGGSGEDPMQAAFAAGEPYRPSGSGWADMLRSHHAAGRPQRRVHIVTEPLSDYLRFELTWGYGPHVAAGEDIRLLVAPPWPEGVPRRDFWLFDDKSVYWMDYDPAGTWLGSEWTDDADDVAEARRVRDLVWPLAQPWARFVADRPELAALVPVSV